MHPLELTQLIINRSLHPNVTFGYEQHSSCALCLYA